MMPIKPSQQLTRVITIYQFDHVPTLPFLQRFTFTEEILTPIMCARYLVVLLLTKQSIDFTISLTI